MVGGDKEPERGKAKLAEEGAGVAHGVGWRGCGGQHRTPAEGSVWSVWSES